MASELGRLKYPAAHGPLVGPGSGASYEDGLDWKDGNVLAAPRGANASKKFELTIPSGLGAVKVGSNVDDTANGGGAASASNAGATAPGDNGSGYYSGTGAVLWAGPLVKIRDLSDGTTQLLIRGSMGYDNSNNGIVEFGDYLTSYGADPHGGTYGNAFELQRVRLTFDATGAPASKVFSFQAGKNVPCLRRLQVNGPAIIELSTAPTATLYAQLIIWNADLGPLGMRNIGSASKEAIIANLHLNYALSDVKYRNIWFKAGKVVGDQCGTIKVGGLGDNTVFDWNGLKWLRCLNTVQDLLLMCTTPLGTDPAATRSIQNCGFSVGFVPQITPPAGTAFNGWTFLNNSLLYARPGASAVLNMTVCGFTQWKRNFRLAASTSVAPCYLVEGDYIASDYSGTNAQNPKMFSSSAGLLNFLPEHRGCVFEVSTPSNTVAGSDAGEFYQVGGSNVGTWEKRSIATIGTLDTFTKLNGCIFVGAEDGSQYRWVEPGYITGNTTQPPVAGQEMGRVYVQNCSGNAGPATFGFGHINPGDAFPKDAPGLDVVRPTDNIFVWTYAGAAPSHAHSNLTGNALWAAPINLVIGGAHNGAADTTYLPLYQDAILPSQVRGNVFVGVNSDGNITKYELTSGFTTSGFALPTSEPNAVATLQANNYYTVDPWSGRVANAASYLNTRPGGGPEGPGRRIRTFGASLGIGGADANAQFYSTVQALIVGASLPPWSEATPTVGHPLFLAGHPQNVPGATFDALMAFVKRDWTPESTATTDVLRTGSTTGGQVGAVAQTVYVAPGGGGGGGGGTVPPVQPIPSVPALVGSLLVLFPRWVHRHGRRS